MAENVTDQQQAQTAAGQLVQMVQWLATVEEAAGTFPPVGSVDEDQVEEAQQAVRTARMALSALLGSYVADTNHVQQQAPTPQVQQQTAAQQWTTQQAGRSPIVAARPSQQQPQQYQQGTAQPQQFAGWQQ
ncbi:hypothetical protein [Saccharopolyspora shandongensis]|uniref:hypothetical protein n=1 Tax=Saccharopolyspora shandongensis TaxID=418495 RepID=UPI0033C85C4D